MLERELDRIAGIAVEAVDVTALHVRRAVGALCAALGRTKREVSDLAWDYSELAASVRRSARSSTATDQHAQTSESDEIADVIPIDLRRLRAN
ncbi:hypothetical protein [Mycobacterium sp. 852002-40037_SCH5390672]|uniref:hypothetical protein n=1 Tax=Mycobacterium sp. 852002-40037_SCH5390672 TaxID=1834089 RepID=UPI000AE1520F|nr:hypothetical protein [Mycobacterium sp. 852002-40037_SCH5390672]